ncbi:MAG: LamG-like jellyroll fold domain-containing protein, partial [Planctomycetota bacterium]
RIRTRSADARSYDFGLEKDKVRIERGAGRFGGALSFEAYSKRWVFYPGQKNFAYREKNWNGSVSLWLRLDPAVDLKPGYSDPIQITDKAWNNSSFFLDFTKDNPRDFRLGVFSDLKFWNPDGRKFDDVPEAERPMAVVRPAPFSRKRWTHLVFTFEKFNDEEPARARLFVDGKPASDVPKSAFRFTWIPRDVRIFLGLNFVGQVDDLATFDRALTEKEIGWLYRLEGGVGRLGRRSD